MSKLRIRFSKLEQVKYISHLDVVRTFERAVRRADIPISYSQGFNPRPKMSFGLPLSVGLTSVAEYAEFDMEKEIPIKEIIDRMNNALPKGFRFISANYSEDKSSLMAMVDASSYQVFVQEGISKEFAEEAIKKLLEMNTVVVERETKSGVRTTDIRNEIRRLEAKNEGEKVFFDMLISAGSVMNLKPEIVIKALNQYCDADLEIEAIHRTGLFGVENKEIN